jgi:hypothetical protein
MRLSTRGADDCRALFARPAHSTTEGRILTGYRMELSPIAIGKPLLRK